MWQAYHIAGELTAMSIVGALIHRLSSGRGQQLSTSVHEAVAQNTETDVPSWVLSRTPHHRPTCRHSMPGTPTTSALAMTKDGRWILPYRTYAGRAAEETWRDTVKLLEDYGMAEGLDRPEHAEVTAEQFDLLSMKVDQLVGRLMYDRDVWRDAQKYGLTWAPVRRPEENVEDEHWKMREAFFDVYHDELDESFVYTGGKWLTEGMPWRRGPRP